VIKRLSKKEWLGGKALIQTGLYATSTPFSVHHLTFPRNLQFVFKSGRGGAGNLTSPPEQRLPTTAADGPALERVHSYGRGGSNYRYGDAIPMVDLNKMEDEERRDTKSRASSLNSYVCSLNT